MIRLLRDRLKGSDTAKAAMLAGAALATNALALVFTVVFARILGEEDYGSLAALLSTFLIISVPGFALQVAAARETTLGRLGREGALTATVMHWLMRLVVLSAVVVAVSVLAREQVAAVIGTEDVPWGAAAVLPTACAWMLVCVLRGVLQGLHAYKAVGASMVAEALGRLVFGLVLVAAGAGVAGAYIGTPLSMVAVAAVLVLVLRRVSGPSDHGPERRRLRTLAAETWAPMAALTLVASLQNIDVVLVQHQIGGDPAGAYAAAAVAAKAIVWVAIGVGYYLVPEVARRTREHEDPRQVLLRGLGIVGALAVPALLIFAAVPRLVLELAFGPEYTDAADALTILAVAFCLLALSYLAVQYMLALGRRLFIAPLAVAAVAEPIVLLALGPDELEGFAAIVLVIQAAAAVAMLGLALRTRTAAPGAEAELPTAPAPAPAPEPAPTAAAHVPGPGR